MGVEEKKLMHLFWFMCIN